MEAKQILMLISAGLIVLTAAVHSFMGEKQLLIPLLSERQGILQSGLARSILRVAWHITSAAWLVLAMIMISFVFQPDHALTWTLLSVGASFSIIGIYDAFASRGRHIGWPLLTGIGVTALVAVFFP